MPKLAFKMKLLPGMKEEYQKRHDEIWPELKEVLSNAGISDYYIFFDEESNNLFAVQTQDGGRSSQDLGSNPIVQKWWKYMSDIMETNPDLSPVSTPMEQVFYLK